MPSPRYYSFFRNVQKEPRRFQYKYRFHDPKKEELEARKRRIEREMARERGEEIDNYVPGSINFRKNWKKNNTYSKKSRAASIRLLIILLILIGFTYLAIQWLDGLEGLIDRID